MRAALPGQRDSRRTTMQPNKATCAGRYLLGGLPCKRIQIFTKQTDSDVAFLSSILMVHVSRILLHLRK